MGRETWKQRSFGHYRSPDKPVTVTIVGALAMVNFRAGDLFREAVRRNCAAIVVAHNHPSGDPTPSPDDIAATRTMREAGRLLGIEVLDHLIIGHQRWISMRDRRLGFDD